MSCRAKADKTLKGASPFSSRGANRNRSNSELRDNWVISDCPFMNRETVDVRCRSDLNKSATCAGLFCVRPYSGFGYVFCKRVIFTLHIEKLDSRMLPISPTETAGHPHSRPQREGPLTRSEVLRLPDQALFAVALLISAIARAEWAKAPPARISAATQIASINSCSVAPCRSAALVWPLMQ